MSKKIIMTILLSIVFSLISISIGPATSHACSCVEPPSVESELERSDAVFSGEVLEVKEQKDFGDFMKKRVLFEVTDTWKGFSESQVIITTGSGGGDCGFEFQVGHEYLVYAVESTMYSDESELVTIICDRTTELTSAQEDLAVLGEGKPPTEQVDLKAELAAESDKDNLILWVIGNIALLIVAFFVWRKIRKNQFKNRKLGD